MRNIFLKVHGTILEGNITLMSHSTYKIKYLSLFIITMMICFLLTGCGDKKNKKWFLETYRLLLNEKNTVDENHFLVLVQTYHERTSDIKDWFSDDDFNKDFCEATRESFRENRDSGNCYVALMYFDSIGVDIDDLREAFEEEVQSYVGGDFDTAVALCDEIIDFQDKIDDEIGFYGRIDYGVSEESWDEYDTSELSVDEIDELNRKMRRISTTLEEKYVTQNNVDITKKGMSFSDMLHLIDTLESRGYTDLQVVTADDIIAVLSEKMEPIYLEKNIGGYYDDHTIEREYHFNTTEDMKDIITRDGKSGFANTIDVSYMGDFASHTYDLEYVDENDYYKVKHLRVWDGYFRGFELDVEPSTFQKYNDFFYVVDEDSEGEKVEYLFATTGSEIDIYELDNVLSDLVLKVDDAQKILDVVQAEENSTSINNEQPVNDSTSSDQPLSFILGKEPGEYGKAVTLNAGTEFEEVVNAFYIPAGIYSVTNQDKETVQINIYCGGPEYAGGTESFVTDENCAGPIILMGGEKKALEVKEGQFVVLSSDNENVEFVLKHAKNVTVPRYLTNMLNAEN